VLTPDGGLSRCDDLLGLGDQIGEADDAGAISAEETVDRGQVLPNDGGVKAEYCQQGFCPCPTFVRRESWKAHSDRRGQLGHRARPYRGLVGAGRESSVRLGAERLPG